MQLLHCTLRATTKDLLSFLSDNILTKYLLHMTLWKFNYLIPKKRIQGIKFSTYLAPPENLMILILIATHVVHFYRVFAPTLHHHNFSTLRGGGSCLSISKTRFWPMGWGDGLGMYQQLDGGFGSIRAILPIWGLGAKMGQKPET